MYVLIITIIQQYFQYNFENFFGQFYKIKPEKWCSQGYTGYTPNALPVVMEHTISDYTYSANIFRKTTEGVFSVKLTVLRSIKMYLRAILKHLYCAAVCRFDRKYSFHCLSKKHLDISSKIHMRVKNAFHIRKSTSNIGQK